MSVSVVQNTAASTDTSSAVVALSSATTSGNMLIASICMNGGASVSSITDSTSNRWIRCSKSYQPNAGVEMWYSRGIAGGSASVTVDFTIAVSAGVNVLEASGLWFVDPLDQWTQTTGTNASVIPQGVSPRTHGELVVAGCASNASVGPPSGGFSSLNMSGGTNFAAAYSVLGSSGSDSTSWSSPSANSWAAVQACFVPGESDTNPNLQFPEVLVEISTTDNYLAPIQGTGIWTNISSYVQSMSLGPLGRQHELDRIQATSGSFDVDARDGSFNPWNTGSFLYNGGYGLQPMNPMKVTAAWDGVTYPVFYGYFQGITPQIHDVLNVDATIKAVDILQILSLKYLANDNYAQLVKSDGGSNLVAYYRLGDTPGSYRVTDSSGNSRTGSLIDGPAGDPAFGQPGAMLYDANTALDLTNGTNAANTGFSMIDNTTQPPTSHSPLDSTVNWTLECWVKWTGSAAPSPSVAAQGSSSSVAAVDNGILFSGTATDQGTGDSMYFELQAGELYTQSLGSTTVLVPNTLVIASSVGAVQEFVGTPVQSDIFDGNWHYVAWGLQGPQGYVVVVDQDVQPVNSTQQAASITGLYVGTGASPLAQYGMYSAPWSGLIQDVALYDNYMLYSPFPENHYAYGKWFQSIELGAAPGDVSKARFNKVMEVSGLDPSIMLYVPYAWKTELYAETNPVTTTSGLNYMQTTSETEPGLIFQAPDGMIYAYSRQYQYLNPTSTSSQATIGDSTGATYYYDSSLKIVNDDLDIWNDIQVQSGRGGFQVGSGTTTTNPGTAQVTGNLAGGQLQEWGPAQSSVAAQSASVYGSRTLQGLTSLQQEYDSDALALAQWYLDIYANPIQRVESIRMNSYANGGANLVQMLARGIYDRVTVEYQGQTPGPTFSQDSLVESVSHHVTMQNGPVWATSWALSPYEILLHATELGTWTFGSAASVGSLTL